MGKKVCVVTPAYNAENLIQESVESVIKNTCFLSGDVSLYYVIVDGDSTDNTVMILEKIKRENIASNVNINILSEKDTGMYDALSKGFQSLPKGDLYCYLNAGDLLSPHAFEIVLTMFEKKIKWISGLTVIYNEKSHFINAWLSPGYKSNLIKTGFYGRLLPGIQQESTFWNQELQSLIDYKLLKRFKLAGDFYLWKLFSGHASLFVIQAWLGGFKIHRGQLSDNKKKYREEMRIIRDKPVFKDYISVFFEMVKWSLPNGIAKRINKRIIYFDISTNQYKVRYEDG